MYRVVALDLDGTLLRSDGTISPRTLAALGRCREAGLRLVVATARPPRSVAAMLPPPFPPSPWVCYNGAEVYDAGRRVIQQAIPPTVAREIVAYLHARVPDAAVSVEIDDRLFANQPLGAPVLHEVVDLETVVNRPVAKILFDARRIGDLETLRSSLSTHCRLVITDRGRLGQIMLTSVSKASALKILLDQWRLGFGDVIAFGDDVNDLDLLSSSGTGVAMANATWEVVAVANRITLSNDEDGVAVVLEEMLRLSDR